MGALSCFAALCGKNGSVCGTESLAWNLLSGREEIFISFSTTAGRQRDLLCTLHPQQTATNSRTPPCLRPQAAYTEQKPSLQLETVAAHAAAMVYQQPLFEQQQLQQPQRAVSPLPSQCYTIERSSGGRPLYDLYGTNGRFLCRMEMIKAPADGDCFFHALAYNLQGKKARELRKSAAEYARHHKEFFYHFHMVDNPFDEDAPSSQNGLDWHAFDKFMEHMAESRTYATHMLIQATAQMLQTNFVIYNDARNSTLFVPGTDDQDKPPIVLFHNGFTNEKAHFDAFRDVGNDGGSLQPPSRTLLPPYVAGKVQHQLEPGQHQQQRVPPSQHQRVYVQGTQFERDDTSMDVSTDAANQANPEPLDDVGLLGDQLEVQGVQAAMLASSEGIPDEDSTECKVEIQQDNDDDGEDDNDDDSFENAQLQRNQRNGTLYSEVAENPRGIFPSTATSPGLVVDAKQVIAMPASCRPGSADFDGTCLVLPGVQAGVEPPNLPIGGSQEDSVVAGISGFETGFVIREKNIHPQLYEKTLVSAFVPSPMKQFFKERKSRTREHVRFCKPPKKEKHCNKQRVNLQPQAAVPGGKKILSKLFLLINITAVLIATNFLVKAEDQWRTYTFEAFPNQITFCFGGCTIPESATVQSSTVTHAAESVNYHLPELPKNGHVPFIFNPPSSHKMSRNRVHPIDPQTFQSTLSLLGPPPRPTRSHLPCPLGWPRYSPPVALFYSYFAFPYRSSSGGVKTTAGAAKKGKPT